MSRAGQRRYTLGGMNRTRKWRLLAASGIVGILALSGCSDPAGAPAGAGDRVEPTSASGTSGRPATDFDGTLQGLSHPDNLVPCPTESDNPSAAVPGLPVEAIACLDGTGGVSLAGLRGTPLVVNAWASWCPPCVAELPILADAANALAGKVNFIGINIEDDPQAALDMIGQMQLPFPSVFDPTGKTRASLSMPGTPVTFFVNADGVIVGRHDGMFPDHATFEAELAQYLGIQ